MWKYNHWLEDKHEEWELAKNHAYLCGYPEVSKKLIEDNGNKHVSDEEDMIKSMEMVTSQPLPKSKRNRKRKVISE